ncbi:MAG: uroporphyrinogen decarboxylase family protein [Phycisphaerae bacterium]|nr:uroporphyrinogen decarboxylase family protein [Phycisphaerae bacterium]
MNSLTGKERISRILRHQPVDRVGLFEVFWKETARKWADEGHFDEPEMVSDNFGLDVRRTGGEITPGWWRVVDLVADPDAGNQVVEEDETSKLIRDGNGALLRWVKGGSGAPEHVGFLVKERRDWEEHIRPRLLDSTTYERRVNFEGYREAKGRCARQEVFLCAGFVAPFDLMSPMCGHENLLMGMALDPDWVRDMCDVYSRVTIHLLEMLFDREGLPDGIWVWDDLGFRNGPFMSPAMYREILFPTHKRLFDFAHSRKLPVVLHTDGFVESLLPSLIEAGIDCLQPMEVKSGMDLLKIKKAYGDRIALIGGMDERVLETNDRRAVLAELERKLPAAMAGGGYVLQVDHSVSNLVDYETYRYFVETGLKLGAYDR